MGAAALPPDEGDRLAVLRELEILDSQPERCFDQLTQLAAALCEAPIALISLVDEERQWFKSRVGLALDETPRDLAFCAHAILEDDLMVVDDALADARFADNPLVVADPKIRFYAGVPLRTRDGHALGTMCVIDRVPRRLARHQSQALRALARHTASQLELRRVQIRLREKMRAWERTAEGGSKELAALYVHLRHAVEERERASTELRRLERRFQSLEAQDLVGRMASGIAHDVNNLLTVVLGHVESLVLGLPGDDPLREHALAIQEAATRSSALTRRVLRSGRRGHPRPRVVDLNATLDEVQPMLRHLLDPRIDLVLQPSRQPVHVQVDPTQLEQVLINLAINAVDAMPGGGRLLLSVSERELDGADREALGGGVSGRFAVLRVLESGSGMDSETMSRALEPFFTTKEGGTGLGLATVAAIVRENGGLVSITSQVGAGTTISICLPLSEGGPEQEPAPLEAPRPEVAGGECVLVVEREELIRRLLADVLSEQDYQVLEADCGAKALSVVREHVGRVQLLVSDFSSTRDAGQEWLDGLCAEHPKLRVLQLFSEPSAEAREAQREQRRGVARMGKPFSPATLCQAVRELLDQPDD